MQVVDWYRGCYTLKKKNKQPNQPSLVEGIAPIGGSLRLRCITNSESRKQWELTKRAHRNSKQHATYMLILKALLQAGTGKMQVCLLLCTQCMPHHQGAPAQVN